MQYLDQPSPSPGMPRLPSSTGRAATDRLTELRAEVAAIGTARQIEIRLPWSGRRYRLIQPTDTDALLDRVADDPEQNLPYWSEIWPSGIALADAIVRQPRALQGKRVLELGSGLGVTAIAALQAGAELIAVDYAPESLALCCLNALHNSGREPATRRLNWRDPESAFPDQADAGYPVVLAADVLYEARDIDPLLILVDRLVAPNGLLWLAEPGRQVARRFLDAARERGWQIVSRSHPGPWPDPKDDWITVQLHKLRRRR